MRALERAAELLGGPETLAQHLNVQPAQLDLWLRGIEPTPLTVFLSAVDLILEHEPIPGILQEPPGKTPDSGAREPRELSLVAAAAIAFDQLTPQATSIYEAEHLTDVLDLTGSAICQLVPITACDAASGAVRHYEPDEMAGAQCSKGATLVTLADGRQLSDIRLLRTDMRRAIAALRNSPAQTALLSAGGPSLQQRH
jgi:hypothetical protein